MAETRGKARDTDACPFSNEGRLNVQSDGKLACDSCGRHLENQPRDREHFAASDMAQIIDPLYRLRRWQQRIRVSNATEKNLAFALSELERLAASNNLPRTAKESAVTVYRKAVGRNLVRGRSIECVAAASVYASCRLCSIPRTIDEISDTSGISKKELGRTYRFLARELKLNLLPAKPHDYVPRFCSALHLSEKTAGTAVELLDKAAEKDLLSGLGPSGTAAGAVYIAAIICGEHSSQRDVATAADITEVTLRCRYKKLAEALGIRIEFA